MLPDEEAKARERLLAHILWFVPAVAKVPGVRWIGLLGSMLTYKKNPKDIDFVVMVEDDADLEPLARLGRRVKGRAQQINRGADIFLVNLERRYIGRTCSWKQCGFGVRRSCDALNCGRRHYLHDDMKSVRLSEEAITGVFELWPRIEVSAGLPEDVRDVVEQLSNSGEE